MFDSCGCLCVVAGHSSVCQTTPRQGLTHDAAPFLLIFPGADVCRACHEAVVRSQRRTRVAALRVSR